MRYGWVLPYGDARAASELATVAEEHGWDGFFVWDPVWGLDAWVLLAAAAMTTERIRLGTMLTPLPRRKPWDVSGSVATVDGLSGGRLILAVGLGAPGDRWYMFEDDPGRTVRAERMDEGLDVVTGLWGGQPFAYEGSHYRARPTDMMVPPSPVQQPRVPIWVVGGWPRPRSMRRAARWDGWLPAFMPKGATERHDLTPEHLREGIAWIRERRADEGLTMNGYDVPVEGVTEPGGGAEVVAPWIEAGATWWIEADWSADAAALRRRIEAGPPRG